MKAQSLCRNFCNRRLRISFASSDSPLFDVDSFAMNDDDVACAGLSNVGSLLGLGSLVESGKLSSLPMSSSFTSASEIGFTSDLTVCSAAVGVVADVDAAGCVWMGMGGRLATTA